VYELLIRQAVIYSPTVRHDGSAWPNPILNNTQKCVQIPRRNRHSEKYIHFHIYNCRKPKSLQSNAPCRIFNDQFWLRQFPQSLPACPKFQISVLTKKMQSSRQNELQSMTLLYLYRQFPTISIVLGWRKTSQIAQKWQIIFWENFCLPNHVPATKLFAKWCFLVTLLQPRAISELPDGTDFYTSQFCTDDHICRKSRHLRWRDAAERTHVTESRCPWLLQIWKKDHCTAMAWHIFDSERINNANCKWQCANVMRLDDHCHSISWLTDAYTCIAFDGARNSACTGHQCTRGSKRCHRIMLESLRQIGKHVTLQFRGVVGLCFRGNLYTPAVTHTWRGLL